MSIRYRVFFYIVIVFSILIIAVFGISRVFFMKNLEDAEISETSLHIDSVDYIIEQERHALDSAAVDWASWDDSYQFIEDGNQDYINLNVLSGTFVDLHLNMIVFIDSSGRFVYGKMYDQENDEIRDLPDVVISYLSDNDYLLQNSSGGKSGILLIPELSPMLIASRPVLPSLEDEPSRGILMFGRFLDESWVDTISIYHDANYALYRIVDTDIPDDVSDVIAENDSLTENAIVRILNSDFIAGYLLLDDITDEPALVVRMEMPRDISKAGSQGITYLIVSLIGLGLVLIGGSVVFADKVGLIKLKEIAERVNEIGISGDISKRVDVVGNDELSVLTRNINNMLANLQELYEKEAELSSRLEDEITKRVDFTRALVHELRTPLTPILTTSDMLLDEVKEEPLRSMIENIFRGSVRLDKRINELLDLTRGEVGGLEISLASVDPVSLIREAVAEVEPIAIERKKTIHLEMPDSLPNILADEDRIEQVITNLLENACKYSIRGDTINVTVKTDSDSLIVEVQDHGPGIEEEDQERLFDPYFRSKKDGQHAGGLGLGLPLCKTIIDLHNGKIWVKSHSGEGATFGFSIPLDLTTVGKQNESTGN